MPRKCRCIARSVKKISDPLKCVRSRSAGWHDVARRARNDGEHPIRQRSASEPSNKVLVRCVHHMRSEPTFKMLPTEMPNDGH